MGEKPQNIKHRHISLGVLAHVDAGKTTLSEGLLFKCGRIRKIGRVDHKDAYLDTYELERERGITIFSKQAVFSMGDMEVTLLDTPGHVDFSAEMERTLQVLDYAILVINGADGVQGHTQTLWRLLTQYKIPTFLFVNKMDQEGTDRERLLEELKKKLSGCCVDFSGELECSGAEAAGKKENPVDNSGKSPSAEGMQLKDNVSEAEKENISGTQGASDKINGTDDFLENIAMCEENLLESFLETGTIAKKDVAELILERKLFPCFFGSALKMEGVDAFIHGMETYMAFIPYIRIAKPTKIAPTSFFFWLFVNMIRTTPISARIGENDVGLKSWIIKLSLWIPVRLKIHEVTVVPILAPMMIPTTWDSFMIPEFTKPTTITVVAEDDWITAVTPIPRRTALMGLEVSVSRILSSFPPATFASPSPIKFIP